jgi:hypothetical protein
MPNQLKTDENGDIITCPVIGWNTGIMAESAILLAIDYIETLEEFAAGGKSVQLALTPPQALELSGKLSSLANRLLQPPGPEVTRH